MVTEGNTGDGAGAERAGGEPSRMELDRWAGHGHGGHPWGAMERFQ